MYVAAGMVALVYLVLGILSRKEIADSKVSGVFLPFYRMALYLYKWVCIRGVPFLSSGQVERDLEKLHPGERKKQLATDYYVGKLAKSLMICLVGTFLGVVTFAQSEGNSVVTSEGTVLRGTYEEGTKEVGLVCELPEGEQEFQVQVAAESFTEEEIGELYRKFCQELPDMILGENTSPDAISGNLLLLEAYEGYPFLVGWESGNPDVIHSDGTMGRVEKAQDVELKAVISYEEREWEKTISVRVTPPDLSEEERLRLELEQMLITAESSNRTDAEWKLPGSWEGQELTWKQASDNTGLILWLGAIAVAVLVYLLADKDLHDEVEKRKLQMKRAYPDVVHKLVLYLGAGMTIRGAFQKMAEEYEQTVAEGAISNPVYEEMVHACRELKTGMSEGAVYEHFGKRTGLQEYIRLSTFLTQNLKKGSSTLLQRLKEEASKASQERIQYGKRLGEEAVTKLLLPMVMMLLVVMLMIMFPAFSSVGM